MCLLLGRDYHVQSVQRIGYNLYSALPCFGSGTNLDGDQCDAFMR